METKTNCSDIAIKAIKSLITEREFKYRTGISLDEVRLAIEKMGGVPSLT